MSFLSGDLGGICSRHKARIHIYHRQDGAGLEHRIEGSLSPTANPVSSGDGKADDRSVHQSRYHRGKGALSTSRHDKCIRIRHPL